MNIQLSEAARAWFKEEMDVAPGDAINFFARYGGASPLHAGFSLGMMKDEPREIAAESIYDEVRYYVEREDEWYFSDHDLHIDVDETLSELTFQYKKS